MNTLIPGAPLRSLSPTSIEYQRAQGASRAAKPARAARFTLDAPEHSGTIPGAIGDILPPGVALTSNLAVIFTLNQYSITLDRGHRQPGSCIQHGGILDISARRSGHVFILPRAHQPSRGFLRGRSALRLQHLEHQRAEPHPDSFQPVVSFSTLGTGVPWCITLDNSKGISRLRFWAKNRRVNGINDLPVFMHQGTRAVQQRLFGVNVRVEPVGVLPLHLSELAVLVKLRGLFPTC